MHISELFGDLSQAACAAVKNTTKRSWVRLVGMRYDLQLWKSDDRIPPMTNFSRKYTPTSLSPAEAWIPKILEPWRKAYKLMENCELFFPGHVSPAY